jgi:NADH:ubiquinone reductase (H+-translocating)
MMNVTIVGGGFGGVKTALELSKHSNVQVTLITEMPHFQYYPALYDAATGHSHLEAWVPLSRIFESRPNVEVVIDSITTIDPNARIVTGASGKEYGYETIVLALGSVTTYFGIKGLDQYSYGIKSVAEVNAFKRHLYEEMGKEHEIDKHYVVVGAGPTGVELSAALVSYLDRLRKQFHLIDGRKIHIDLVEAAPRVLPRMSEGASKIVHKRLEKLGVKVHLGKAVQSQNADSLMVSGKPISSHTVIWTSGVANNPFYKANEQHFKFAPNGKVIVNEYMQAMGNVYVIGDNAATPFTGLAQTALHDAQFVSGNLIRLQHHHKAVPYKAVKPPVVVPVGERWAIFEWGKLRLWGWPASLLRRAADFIGYHDVLPIGQALGVWRASRIMDDDFQSVPIQTHSSQKDK